MAKKRYYYAPGKYFYRLDAPDQFTNQTLKALATKLSRDYLGFFDSLRKMYGQSKQGKQVDEAVVETKKAISLLDSVLSTNSMTKEDAENLVGHIEALNNMRDFFLEQAETVKAARERIDKVTKATGISPQDLNITKDIVMKGASRAQQTSREGVLPFLQRTMPRTTGAISGVAKETGRAFLGPFAPLAGIAGTTAKELLGVARGLKEKRMQRQERALGAQLRPMAMATPTTAFERISAARQQGMPVTGFRGFSPRGAAKRPSKEEMVLPLTYFFDKKAHKAKWTRDVLTRFKELEKKLSGKGLAGMLGLGGLGEKFGALGASILPLVGKAGLFAALAAGVGLSIKKFTEFGKGWKELSKARDAQIKAAKGLAKVTEQKKQVISRMGIEQYAQKVGKSPRQVAMDVASSEQQAELSEYHGRPWYKRLPGSGFFVKKPEIQPFYQRVAEIESEFGSPPRAGAGMMPQGTPPGGGISAAEMKNLQESIDKLSTEIRREKGPDGIRSAGLGNPYDSGDALLNSHAEGTLSIRTD